MRIICSGTMIFTPMTISRLDSMKSSSKTASRMCSSCTAVQSSGPARAAPRHEAHGQIATVHGRAAPLVCPCSSQKPRHSSVLRPIDPRIAPKPSFTY
ncbi:unnamed protein product [Linum trigynum]|uniref:Uncharacterized protein n=1 Tax=Linum trigynum TaxID=586398 RepID=A0AAV2EWS0_9ROSI